VASGRRLAPLEAVAGEARALGRRSLALSCDVRQAAQVDQVVAETVREFGRIDLLVNNAGYRIRAPLDQLPREEWDAMLGPTSPACSSAARPSDA
jgi:NAD(P)-dependent dehydrogenase (short-subunit alcohol dehydrogenase family)